MEAECPFCGDDEFDLIGLKHHLTSGQCADFNDVESLAEEAVRQAREEVDGNIDGSAGTGIDEFDNHTLDIKDE